MMREFNFTTTPIVDIVNDIIIDSVVKNASDIHFDPAENYLKIRIRIDGELRDYAIIDNMYKRNLTTRIKLLAGMNITESRLPQDGAIKSVIEGKDLDLRVSALPTSFGEKIVIRILDYSMSLQGIEHLGFTGENYNIIMEMLNSPNGIILITGATGSGKSTTVYSMLQKLNKEESNIITVEDPVEMSIEGLNQVQVNSEIGLDFATVLRSILRQDPNIILIGEIRDSETAKIAIRASITGHLVLSTLHTNNSITTIERLIDMDVERYLLSSSLKGIISQTLAKRLCPNCRVQRPANNAEKTLFKKALGIDINTIYEASRCDNCHNGYTGRIALQEVLLINEEIRDAINRNIDREELKHLIYKKGVKTLFQDGLIKVMEGITDLKEVFRLVDYDDYDDVSEEIERETIGISNDSNNYKPAINSSQISNVNQNNVYETNTNNSITPNNILDSANNIKQNDNSLNISNNLSNSGIISDNLKQSSSDSLNNKNVVEVSNNNINRENNVSNQSNIYDTSTSITPNNILGNIPNNNILNTPTQNSINSLNNENVITTPTNNINTNTSITSNNILDSVNNIRQNDNSLNTNNNLSNSGIISKSYDSLNNENSTNQNSEYKINTSITPNNILDSANNIKQNDTNQNNSADINSIFENTKDGNLFDDNVFNSLRIDNKNNNNVSNYTDDLLNMINNNV